MPSYGLSVRILDGASAALDALRGAIDRRTYIPAVGEAGKRVLLEHFSRRNQDPAAHRTGAGFGVSGGSGLYAQFARSTSWSVAAAGVTLSVGHVAARQRLLGGTIDPVHGNYLTIPARGESYGKRAREFGQSLVVLFGRNGPYALAAKTDFQRAKKSGKNAGQLQRAKKGESATHGQGGVYYWLVRSVTQVGDPDVLPPEAGPSSISAGISEQLRTWCDHAVRGQHHV